MNMRFFIHLKYEKTYCSNTTMSFPINVLHRILVFMPVMKNIENHVFPIKKYDPRSIWV